MTTIGELAASLAHEISQPVGGAVINAGVCLRKLGHDKPDLDDARVAASRMLRDAQRATEIVGRIRLQFEKAPPKHEPVDINEIIREILALLRGEALRYNVSARTELRPNLPPIVGDRAQLQQVAMNLIVNSIEAMRESQDKREIFIVSRRCKSGQILLSFVGSGPGFAPHVVEQIFDPFFATKSHGTGMGLRISRSVIELHNGRIWSESAEERGATFHITLPATVYPNSENSVPCSA